MVSYNVRSLLERATGRGASDLHLVVDLPPSVRRDGEIEFLPDEPLRGELLEPALLELISAEQRARLESNRDLEFSFSEPALGRFRVSYYYSCERLEACFRVVPSYLPDFETLGLPPVVEELASKTSGLVLITGATGQGKTTTMNALIHWINGERRARIVTIEDPIEFLHSNRRGVVIQREVGSDATSFAGALTAALRQDPNVICVGELRTLEAMSTALTAAETGHLVLATLHTSTAAGAVERMVDVFPAHQQNQVRVQLAASLRGVICQQLLPRAGGKGRVLACEVMMATQGVRTLIRGGRTDQLYNTIMMGTGEGMVSMDQCLRHLYETGQISYDVAVGHAQAPNTVRRIAS